MQECSAAPREGPDFNARESEISDTVEFPRTSSVANCDAESTGCIAADTAANHRSMSDGAPPPRDADSTTWTSPYPQARDGFSGRFFRHLESFEHRVPTVATRSIFSREHADCQPYHPGVGLTVTVGAFPRRPQMLKMCSQLFR